MVTLQGSILIALATIVASAGIIAEKPLPATTGLALLLWIWLEWIWFEIARKRLRRFIDDLKRTINDDPNEKLTLVTDRNYQVRFSGAAKLLPRGYRIVLRDVVPDTFKVEKTSVTVIETDVIGWFRSIIPERIGHEYCVQTPVCGTYHFQGIEVEITDQRGLFAAEYFAPIFQRTNVLPFLIRPQTTLSVLKRNNLERHLGHHRHHSSGISSELHGIRDYRTGDPPRSIAWKATARLGKLMTCEFESEVPIRATILTDLAAYQFDGRPGPTAGDRAISTTASIAKLLLADRDPVSVELIHEHRFTRLNHGSGERQLAIIIQNLLAFSNPNAPLDHFYIHDLIQIVFENASKRFPELFDEGINYGRARIDWLRLLIRTVRSMVFLKNDKLLHRKKRRLLSVVFEYLFQLAPGAANRLQFDDVELRKMCLKYADEYNIFSTSSTLAIDPPYQDVSQWLRARNNMTLKLCERITSCRARAKDNELFVVVAPEPFDLLGCEMIESAVKKVIASGHRMMFVVPERPLIMGLVEDDDAAELISKYVTGSYRKAQSDLGEAARKRRGVLRPN